MKVTTQQLDNHLGQAYPVYLLSGDNPFFIKESFNKIIHALNIDKKNELIRLHVENKSFSWDTLTLQASHPSLFNDTNYLYIKLSISLDKSQQLKLLELFETGSHSIFIIETQKITPAQLKQSWLQWIEKKGLHVTSSPLSLQDTLGWIKSHMKQRGLITTDEGYQLIALSTEGNMLALSQLLEQLSLIFDDGHIPLSELKACLSRHAHYNIYQCVDEAFNQNTKRMLNIFNTLKQSHIEPTLLLWALLRELRTVTMMRHEYDKGKNISSLMKQYRIWGSKTAGIERSLKDHSLKSFYALFQEAKRIDETMKGLKEGNIWHKLKHLFVATSMPSVSL